MIHHGLMSPTSEYESPRMPSFGQYLSYIDAISPPNSFRYKLQSLFLKAISSQSSYVLYMPTSGRQGRNTEPEATLIPV